MPNETARHVLIVLPAYNEAANIPPLLEGIEQTAAATPELSLEVVVVDDGSSDGTAGAARSRGKVPVALAKHPRNLGLAAAFRTGMIEAIGRSGADGVIVVMDADNSHLPSQIPALVRKLDEGCDVAIASRYRPGARVRGVPRHRQALSAAMGLLFKAINPIRGVRDYSCGFRAYSGRLLSQAYQRQGERLFSREGFACMVAILLRLDEEKAVFGEVPIDLRYDKKVGASKMKVLSTVSKTLGVLGRERLARLRRRSLEVCP